MQKVFEIVRIEEMSVVTQSGNHCRDTYDETEYIEVGKLVASFDSLQESEEWLTNFFDSLDVIKKKIRDADKELNSYRVTDKLNFEINEFYRKFIYISSIQRFFDSYKFEIKTRYIAD